MASGRAVQAIASGPKHGASMTSSRTHAVQRADPHIADSITVPSTQYPVPSSLSSGSSGYWQLGTGYRFLYHFSVHSLAEQLLKTIRKQESMRAGDRLAVAVSGGADSVALLCLLLELRAELGIVLSVAHINHKLRGKESDEDEHFVAQLAGQHGLAFHVHQAPVDSSASSGIEAAARELRYGFFRQLAREGQVEKIATAHTLDDQAETVLLRIFRGTGIRGLSGIHPRIVFEEQGHAFGEVVRPLLNFRRATLLEFLRECGQSWREDASNRDVAFLRNRVRHRLLPLIAEEFGEAAIEHMGELAEIARAEEEVLSTQYPVPSSGQTDVGRSPQATASLPVGLLPALPLAAQRRLLRRWLEATAPDLSISFRLIDEALDLAQRSASGRLALAGGLNLRLNRQELLLESKRVGGQKARDYEYALVVPGTVEVPELGACIEARVVDVADVPEKERGQLLDLERVPKLVVVRNWRAGDRYWPAHTAAARKVKELLSDRHATGPEKKFWPVAYAEGCGLVWMRGFAVPAAVRARAGASRAIWIREIAAMM
jgi:tRNA(Ile)-lysidine synthase